MQPLLLLGAAVLFAIAPLLIHLPEPDEGTALTEARLSLNGAERGVELPNAWPRDMGPGPATATYAVEFSIGELPATPQGLFVPAARQHLRVELNGSPLAATMAPTWANPVAGTTHLLRLPADLLKRGANRLVLTLERADGGVPGYLSRLYAGDLETLVGYYWLRALNSDQVRATVYALQLLIVAGIITVWGARRHDPVFGWLLLLGATNLVLSTSDAVALAPLLKPVQPYLVVALSSFGVMVIGLTMAFAGMARPRWLPWAVVVVPGALLVAMLVGQAPVFRIGGLSALIAIGGHLAGAVILVVASLRRRQWELGFLAIPFFLTGWFGLHDVAITLGLIDRPFLLSYYVRPLVLLAVMVVLMRRLATSLNGLDAANETLRHRLAEREDELSRLHEKERRRAAQAAREQERERLMQDLHDGLSGHLVSIIALSEREGSDPATIERAAREALNDLRLVINSLDIGDRDLPLALAGFRERLVPQLRRLGVDFSWSMEGLPDVSGVTPGNALSVLRILQEAVTNAIKHGPATRIALLGTRGEDGDALIIVDNDGTGAPEEGTGHGLHNMRRRAAQLGAKVLLQRQEGGMRLVLSLPPSLPDSAR